LDQQQLQLRLQWHYQQLQQQASQLQQLQQQLLPQAQLLVRQSQQAWQQGVLSTADWLSSRQELLQTELEQIELRAAFASRLLELQLLTGQPLLQQAGHPFTTRAPSQRYRALPASMQAASDQTSTGHQP
jgi:cobalt-zinc-cadmium efflux system outer membrane protein